jgi:galactonate dehydratase
VADEGATEEQGVKITDIKTYSLPMDIKNQFIVKVETDEGISGWGEGGLSTRDLAMKGAVEHYRQWLIGRDPMKRGALWQEMYRCQYFEGGRVLTAAQSALDMAFYDITGKALGVPVYQLLGGKHRDVVPTFPSTGGRTVDELVANTRALLDRGWECVRVNTRWSDPNDPSHFEPRKSIAGSAEMFTELRRAVGLAPVLGTDYHHRLTVAETASFCQRMPMGTLDWVEEPIRDESPEAYAELRKLTDIPFAIGEEFSSKWEFLPFIERGLTNYARVDLCNVGGFTEAMKVAGWCEAHYVDLMPHNPLGPICTAGAIHMAAAVPNFSWLELNLGRSEPDKLNREIFRQQPVLDGTVFPVSETPGLGIDVDEERLAAVPFRFAEFPHLHRADGSHTNW